MEHNPFDLTEKPNFRTKEFGYIMKESSSDIQLEAFKNMIETGASETELDKFITENPVILSFALFAYRTGHHGSWILPKQMIRPKINGRKGLIPDFIIGGESSNGLNWWVVELKGASDKLFVENANDEIYFSSQANQGISQLLEYVDFCAEYQSTLRDTFNLLNFREPNGLLIIGRENEFNNKKRQKLKAAWNRVVNSRLEIRTYDFLLKAITEYIEAKNRKN